MEGPGPGGPCAPSRGFWILSYRLGVSTLFCAGPASKYFQVCGPCVSVGTTELCDCMVKAALDVCGWVPIRLCLWRLKFEFHVTLHSMKFSSFTFFLPTILKFSEPFSCWLYKNTVVKSLLTPGTDCPCLLQHKVEPEKTRSDALFTPSFRAFIPGHLNFSPSFLPT